MDIENDLALKSGSIPETIWVCTACGKMSHDKSGSRPINWGWDVSCFLNAVEVEKDKVVVGDDGYALVRNGIVTTLA